MSEHFKNRMQISRNISASFIFKGANIFIGFLIVPLLIEYLNPENYGVWILMSSIIAWLSLFDMGLGNGLRNKLVESIAIKDRELSQVYISTSYAVISIVTLIIYILFIFINSFVDWQKVFNTTLIASNDLNTIVLLYFALLMLQSIFQLINVIFTAHQKSAYKDAIGAISAIIIYIVLYGLAETPYKGLLNVSIVHGVIPTIVLMLFSLFFFKVDYKKIRPSFKSVNFRRIRELMGLGVKFYTIQVAAVILLASDSIIIAQILGPEDVTIYNIAFKYFSLPILIFTIVSTPYWSSFTAAHSESEFDWVERSIKILKKVWLGVLLGIMIMIPLSENFYSIWIGSEIKIPFFLSCAMALYAILLTWGSIYVTYLNGIGKIKLQMYETVFIIFFNIPMSIYFADNLELGSTGVILGTCISLSIGAILMPLQVSKLLHKTAKGIWNE
jgi:O-antigen/teichoic acid export membrane protein